jgi:hypothetical protein
MNSFIRTLGFAAGLLCAASVAITVAAAPASTIPDAASSVPDAERALTPDRLAAELRKGGYVIYFRHTATDFSQSDEGMKSYEDCAHQRMLSAQGRKTAREIGEQIRALRVPAGDVLASPFCRTMETAKLMFGQAQARPEIRESEGGDYAGLKRLLAMPVTAGSNRWIVGHGNPFRAVAGPPHLAEGEAAVIRPEGRRWVVVARLMPTEWVGLRSGR